MDEIDRDWYTYLTEDFKLDRSVYKTADRVVVDCPKCNQTRTIRLNHLKAKIKKLGYFECGPCRKAKSLIKARDSFKEKYEVDNPFELKSVRDKIKTTNLEKYGVDCLLKDPEVHNKGVKAAATSEVRDKAMKTFRRNHNYSSPFDLNRKKINETLERHRSENRKFNVDYSTIKYCSVTERTKWMREYIKIRSQNDPNWKPQRLIYSALHRMMFNSEKSTTGILKDIGYSVEEFKVHVESLFEPGMTWDNHGKWHLDHIKPLSSFDLTDTEEVKEANALENLQPLWAADNLRKSNKLS